MDRWDGKMLDGSIRWMDRIWIERMIVRRGQQQGEQAKGAGRQVSKKRRGKKAIRDEQQKDKAKERNSKASEPAKGRKASEQEGQGK
jgi:hypothetical protein